jgi:hypothetical protein
MKEEKFLPMLIFSVIFIDCVIYYLYGYVSILHRIKDIDFKRNVRRIYLIFGIALFYHIGSSFSHLTLKHTSLSESYQMISYSGSVLLALVICVPIIWGSSFQTRLLIRSARALAK